MPINLLTKDEFDKLTPWLIENGTIGNYFPVVHGNLTYWTNKVITDLKFPASYRVTNSTGTYIMEYPDWLSNKVVDGWVAKDAILNALGIITYQDADWIIVENGYVLLFRVSRIG